MRIGSAGPSEPGGQGEQSPPPDYNKPLKAMDNYWGGGGGPP